MNKIILTSLSLFLLLNFSTVKAQTPIQDGEWQMNTGLGFSSWGLPVYFGMEYGIGNDVSIGGEFSYRNYKERIHGVNYGHSIMGFVAIGNYHFNRIMEIPDPWDFYAGLNVGFYTWTSSSDYPDNNNSGLGLGLQIGGRYYFNERLGLNLEFGGGNSVSGGKIGITYKF